MRSTRLNVLLAGLGLFLLTANGAYAQQTTVGSPYGRVGDSFYENIGTSWGMRGNGWFFNFSGGGNFGNPQFGNPQAGAGMNTGFSMLGGPNAYFNLFAGQGSQRSFSSQSPTVTMMNGGTAYFSDTSVTPFVMGFIPVVGSAPMVNGIGSMLPPTISAWSNPSIVPPQNHRVAAMRELMDQRKPAAGNQERPDAVADELNAGLAAAKAMEPKRAAAAPVAVPDEAPAGMMLGGDSSAVVSVPSVAEARRMHAAEQKLDDPEIQAQFARGQVAEENGKPKLAKVYYEMVARRATGELKQQAMERLELLRTAQLSARAE